MTVAQASHVSDAELVLRARAGDSAALGALYVRYFDCVYDFVLRTLRDRAAAEDVAQDTFVKASKSLGNLANAQSFKSWLFSIARRTALNHLRQARPTVSLTVPPPDREDYHLNLVDQDRFSDPAEAAQAAALGSVVWEAAAGLDPGLYTVLDLHVRQGLESPEIAEALRISRNHAAVKLNRTKSTMRRLVTALYLLRQGRRDCSALDATLELEGATLLTPAIRKLIERHAGGCATCAQSRMKLVSPESVFGALAVIPMSAGLLPKILLALGISSAAGAGAATGRGAGTAALDASTTGKGALMPLLTLAVGTAAVVTAAAFAALSLLDPFGNANMVPSSPASAPQQSPTAVPTAGQPTTLTAGPQAPRPPGIEMVQAADTAPFAIVPLPSASDAPGGPPVQAAPPARPQPGAGPAFPPPPPTPPAPAPDSSVDRPPGRLDVVAPPATAPPPPTTSPLPEPPTVPTPSPEPPPPLPQPTPSPAPSPPPPGPTPSPSPPGPTLSPSPPPPIVAACLPQPAHGNVCPPGREDGPPGKSGAAPGHTRKPPPLQGGKAW